MAPIGQFVQLLTALSEMQSRRDQMGLSERELDLREQQFKEMVKSGHNKDVADALQTIMKLAPDARKAFVQMQSEFSPQEMTGFQALITGQPIDPSVLGAQSAQRGYEAAGPQGQASMNAQAASRATTGLDVGQAALSQAQSWMLGGGTPQAMSQAFGPSMQRNWMQGLMQGMATRQTPFQAGVEASAQEQGLVPGFAQSQFGTVPTQYGMLTPQQAAQADIGRGGVRAQFAGVNQRATEAAQAYGMELLKLNASGKGGGFTTSQQVDMMQGISKLLDDMQNPRATKQANMERIRLINSMAATLPPGISDMLTIKDPENAAKPVQMWRQFLNRSFSGLNQPPIQPMPQAPQSQMPLVPPAGPPPLPPMLQANPFMQGQTSPLAPFMR